MVVDGRLDDVSALFLSAGTNFEPPRLDWLDRGYSLSKFHHPSCFTPEWKHKMAQEREGWPQNQWIIQCRAGREAAMRCLFKIFLIVVAVCVEGVLRKPQQRFSFC